ncbi:lipopolysaccharide biosynthesis protein [uncultured Tenacibaculum sp.]|uniref:lipopolysaccharide biosynthesis protein n=1 Tax=uncultured Tenacibaculum sp. TaxID=174713 RepID=UPI002621D200|nr:oligosaccharide flippase family protein [uncultured Tenacibaculum sp.]
MFSKEGKTSWAFLDQALVSGTNFLSNILLAKYLGIEEFGVYVIIVLGMLLFTLIFQSLVTIPMMNITPKVSLKNEYLKVVKIQSIGFSLLLSLLAFLMINLSWIFNKNWDLSDYSLLITLLIFVTLNQDFVRRYFYVKETPKLSFFSDLLRNSLFLGATTSLFLFYDITLRKTLLILTIANLLGVIPFYAIYKNLKVNLENFKVHFFRNWMFSKWLLASSIIQWVSDNTFMLGAGAFLGATAVGAQKAAQSLFGITHIFFHALDNIVPLKIATYIKDNDQTSIVKYIVRLIFVGLFVVGVFTLLFLVFKNTLFETIFNKDYLPYTYLLYYIAIFYISLALTNPIIYLIKATENTKVLFLAQAIISMLFLGVVKLITNKYGVLAQPISSILYQVIFISVILIYFKSNFINIVHKVIDKTKQLEC